MRHFDCSRQKGLVGLTSLDDVIQDVGQCGLYQGILLLSVHSTIVACVGGMMMMAFGSYNPGWDCLDLDLDDGSALANLSSVTDKGNLPQSTPVIPESEQSSLDNPTARCKIFRTCQNVSFHPGSSTIATEWGLVCDRAWALKAILMVQMVGVLLGTYIVGHMGDCIGRKRSLYVMLALHAVFNLLAVFSPSWQVFAAIRFCIGVCSGGIFTPAYTIPLEFTGQLGRGVIAALPTWNICSSIFSLFVILLKDWRHLHLLYAGISCLVFLPAFWVPESFRWLAVHGRDKKASTVASKIARLNGRPSPNLEVLRRMAESERRKAAAERTARYNYLDLFRIALVRKQTLVMSFVRMCMSAMYYGISFNVQALSGNFYINFVILSVMEIPNIIISMPTNSFLSRRFGACLHLFFVTLACLGITIVSLTMTTTASDEDASDDTILKANIILVLAVIAKVGTLCSWNVVTVYCAELYPTVVRNMSFGYLNGTARIGTVLGSVLFPQDPALLYFAMIVLGIMTAISVGLLLLLPETKGAPLEDMFHANSHPDVAHDLSGNNFGKGRNGDKQRAVEYLQRTSVLQTT